MAPAVVSAITEEIMSKKLSIGLSLVALAFGSGCATAPSKVEVAEGPARTTCPGGSVGGDARLDVYAGCQRVTGNLSITAVTSLRSLAKLQRVDGTLTIRTSQLESLAGLEGLQSVGALSIENNADLDDVSALGALRQVETLRFSGNPELSSPEGLEGLTEVEELVIEKSRFQTLDGLNGLRRVGRVEIRENTKLISVAALNQVRAARQVVLRQNPVVCGKMGVLKGLMTPPSELSARQNRALREREIEHLRPLGGDPKVAMR